jgi:hypothetical protein
MMMIIVLRIECVEQFDQNQAIAEAFGDSAVTMLVDYEEEGCKGTAKSGFVNLSLPKDPVKICNGKQLTESRNDANSGANSAMHSLSLSGIAAAAFSVLFVM